MAGDWIKMRINLDTDWRVIEMASQLGIPELHVVGCLWKLWTWADQHTIDGNAIRVTDVTLDRFTSVTGFARALRNVGWLTGENGSLSFPNFAEHNGATAKKRAETKERVAKHRNANRVTGVTQKALPEKRREEKNSICVRDTPSDTKKTDPQRPTLDEVRAYCREQNSPIDPEHFFNFYESNGWTQGRGKAIKDWRAAVRTWEANEKRGHFQPSRKPKPEPEYKVKQPLAMVGT